jgi:hypothetical protein
LSKKNVFEGCSIPLVLPVLPPVGIKDHFFWVINTNKPNSNNNIFAINK